MKHVWLLIVERDSLSLSSRYFRIYVGTSKQDQADWAYVNLYAAIHNYFFEKWNAQVAEFVDNIADSFKCKVIDLNFQSMKVRDLVRYMKEHGDPPKKPSVVRFQDKLHSMVKPSAYFNDQINVIRHAEAKQRNKPKVSDDTPQGD